MVRTNAAAQQIQSAKKRVTATQIVDSEKLAQLLIYNGMMAKWPKRMVYGAFGFFKLFEVDGKPHGHDLKQIHLASGVLKDFWVGKGGKYRRTDRNIIKQLSEVGTVQTKTTTP